MIPFIDLESQQKRIRSKVDTAIAKVLDHGQYIMGPEIAELEKQLSSFCGAKHTLSCSNGTDALALVLRSKGVKEGDAVFVPSFTFAATAEVVAWFGATVIFVDVLPDTFNMDSESLEAGIAKAKRLGLTPKGVIIVDLFGQSADYDVLLPIADKNGLWVIDDAAQSFGGTYKGRRVGTLAETTTTSFFPAKPLGCYGDGGAVFTDDAPLYEILQSLRIHGQGTHKYENVRIGINGRLDTLQAAVLIEKLAIFEEEIYQRQKIADHYNQGLADVSTPPFVMSECQSTWAQYTVKVHPCLRAALIDGLKAQGIPSVIYYPIPLHRQKAYAHFPCASDRLIVTDELADSVFSLPMHAYLPLEDQNRIISTFCELTAQLKAKVA